MDKFILGKLLKLILNFKKEIFICFISTTMISLIGVIDSFFLSYTIDNVLYSNAIYTLLSMAVIMLLIAILQISLRGLKNFLIQKISYKMEENLMQKFYIKILNINYSFFESHKTGELLARLNDIKIVRNTLSEGLISIIANLIMFCVISIALYVINKVLFAIICISVIILSIIAFVYARFFSKEYPVSMEKHADFQSFISETISGIETIKSYSSYKTFEERYEEKQTMNLRSRWHITEKAIQQNLDCSFIEKIASVMIIICGCYFVMHEKISLGQVASFISLSSFFTNSFSALLDLQSEVQESFSAIKRLFEVLDEEAEDESKNEMSALDNVPILSFKNMCFSYENDNTLYKDFSLKIMRGEWISFVGKTGCGKTTLAKLLLKLYKPQSGTISWDSIDIQCLNTNLIRQKIAYIPQDVILFSGTILQNITMFDSSFDDKIIIDIVKKVGIYEKILTLKDGLNTMIGERGFSLSGGEKQKIAICRALIRDPLIIILDEATSNLDSESERDIMEIMKKLIKDGKTIISIAHRLSTVKSSDIIYVIEKGTIIEKGNYESLMNLRGVFFSMYNA